MKKILILLALMSALLVSCEKPENNEPEPEPEPEPEYAISISPAELTFGAEGGEQTVKVTSTYGDEGDLWRLETEEYCDWCEASLSSGENGEEVTFTVDSYDNTDETRTVAFTFYCGDKEAGLIITQEAKVYSISVEPTELTFEVEGGEAEVTVTSSDGWDISNRPDWIDVSERYGENGETIIVAVEEYNTEVDSRSGEIVFTCGDKEAKISVTQKADDSPIIQFKDQYFLKALLAIYRVYWNDTEYYVDIDRNNDGQISEKEASSVEVLDLEKAIDATEQAIRNVEEMSYFTRLRYLSTYKSFTDDVVSLNLSGLSQLEYLKIIAEDVKSLDVSGCVALTDLSCSFNQLTSLDVSNNTALTYLACNDNQLTSLDVSKNTVLETLFCYGNQLTSLDVSNNTALTYLACNDNQLTSLDVSKNTVLTELACSSNQLTSLDLHNNRMLASLYLSDNPLQKLILYKYHILKDYVIEDIESEYDDIIEYME